MNTDPWILEARAEAERRRSWTPPLRRPSLWDRLVPRHLASMAWQALVWAMVIAGCGRCVADVVL